MKKSAFLVATSILLGFSCPSYAGVELMADPNKAPEPLKDVGVKEHLGEQVALQQIKLKWSEDGKEHTLSEFVQDGKPILLNLVYFECPMLCTLVLNGVVKGLKGLDWSVGAQFTVLTVSIDPTEDSEMANAKKTAYIQSYVDSENRKRDPEVVKKGWHFFTGSEAQIKALADQVGFQFKYDDIQQEYAHAAVTFVMTPNGFLSRYLYGIEYRPRDLRLALLEASQGKVGNVFDRLLMFCFHYEPSKRGYALHAVRVMQLSGMATLALLGGYLSVFWLRQRKGKA